MILVDSCVWIDRLRCRETPETRFLDAIERRPDLELCISGIVYFEVLRGIADARQREAVAKALQRLERRDFKPDSVEPMLAHDLRCRRRGIVLEKLGDWLIVQTALDHGLELLTSDKDFSKILPCVPLTLVRP